MTTSNGNLGLSAPRSEQPIQFSHQIHTTLNSENYLLWKSQILPVLRGYDLIGFVDGTRTSPERHLTTTTGVSINPDYTKWHQQDQLILAWLFRSISVPILAQVISAETAFQLWEKLKQIHTSQSLAKVLELRLLLQTSKKGGTICIDFIQQMQSIADRLRSIGSEISEQNLVIYTLQGLGTDYDNFVTAFTMRQQASSMTELQSLLLAREARIQANLKTTTTSAVRLTSTQQASDSNNNNQLHEVFYSAGFQGRGRHNSGRGNQGQYNYNQNRSNYGRGRGNFRGRGRGRSRNNNADAPQCQICTLWGHTAAECYHRFDIRYTATPAPQQQHQALVAEPSTTANHTTSWYLDSGATTHVTPDINNLSHTQPYQGTDTVHIGNGSGLTISHVGYTVLWVNSIPIKLNNVLYVPTITKNLLSVSQLLKDNSVVVEFSLNECFIKDQTTKKILIHGTLHNDLYALQSPQHSHQVFQVSTTSPDIWHSRLVHCASSILNAMSKNNVISMSNKNLSFCMDCNKAKAHQLPFHTVQTSASAPLQVIHTDLWGPAPVLSNNENRYYVHFIDEFTRFSWFYACSCKSNVNRIFDEFKMKVENLLSASIKTVQCDGGLEFKPLMKKYPAITFQMSCPHTPQQNSIAERKHRHLVELSLATMFHSDIPLDYWDWIFESTNYVINRLPSTHTSFISPFEKLFHIKPEYNLLKVIGCACYPLLRPYNSNKMQPRSDTCVFMGYSTMHKGYRCLHLPTKRLCISRNVIFNETDFPFRNMASISQQTPCSFTPHTLTILPNTVNISSPPNQNDYGYNNTGNNQPEIATPLPHPSSTENSNTGHNQPVIHSRKPASVSTHHMQTRQKTKAIKPKNYANYHVYTATRYPVQPPTDEIEPTCYTQASKHSHWRQAMSEELTALATNNTWDLVPLPPNANAVGCKWLYKIKKKSDGSIERYKARLVAKGYTQEEGIDYFETFSLVIRPKTVRIVLSIAISNAWPLHQLDVNNAFLHRELEETVYMQQPPGFSDPMHPTFVCKLNKALYGLKQAPSAWFHKLKAFLIFNEFKQSQADTSLFIYTKGNITVYILIYVDDIIVTGNSSSAINALMKNLHSQFSIKDLGTVHYFLGIEVTTTASGLHLSQNRYLTIILEKASMVGAKPCQTPLQTGVQMSKLDGTPLSDPLMFRTIVGMLQYATITRPDLTFAVNKVSQFFSQPTDIHWQAVKRILRHVKGTLNLGLQIHKSDRLAIQAYCDADWAGDPDDRRSTSGFAVFLGPNLISWSSKKQCTVSRSSTEVEYRSMDVTAAEIMWIQSILTELGHKNTSLPALWCDNLSATFLASNLVFHARTKHIELDYHFVREKLTAKQLMINFICSEDQIADVFTKSLAKARFTVLRSKLTVCSEQLSLRGPVETQILDTSSTGSNGEDNRTLALITKSD
ncbi:hypothetical protein LUZ63_007085 [Rhynchospora breviuscula]|uniref:Integrase catalytic domain-containing protein n=1 Tax=Rhynchospora breviuscula TaxID=2022672 RepID=A0A9Q0CR23_9POAL|nr:hypothetical protein LUZ63_007085 [Rhynchospora breviuscula]